MIIIRMSHKLDPDQAQHFVGPDLGLNCLPRLEANNKSNSALFFVSYFLIFIFFKNFFHDHH